MLRTTSYRLQSGLLTGLSIAALVLLGHVIPAHADKVGVAAAVHPDAFSEGTQVKIGNSIFYNQRINTTGSGLVQVLLVDGSTFTVGPGSDLVINKFVYDPSKNKGEVVATLGKGVLRFVGGKISKNEGGVTVNTPDGALAIRGGMFQGKVDGHHSVFCFLFGVEMKLTSADGQVHRVYEPGYTIDLTSGTPTIRPTTDADTNGFMKALSGGGHVVVGGDKNQGGNQGNTGNTKANTLASITSTASQTQITSQIQNQQNQTNPPPTQTKTSGTVNGYAAGIYQQTAGGQFAGRESPVGAPGALTSQSPNDLSIAFNAQQNTLSATLTVAAADTDGDPFGDRNESHSGITIGFGDSGSTQGRSTFIDDQHYAAIETSSASTTVLVVPNDDTPGVSSVSDSATAYLVSGDQINATKLFPETFGSPHASGNSPAFCTNCDFLKWGAWGERADFTNATNAPTNGGTPASLDVHQGWWVAGTLTSLLNLDTLWKQTASASYDGHALGDVAANVNGGWKTYVAAGNMHMDWNFGARNGSLQISNFDANGPMGALNVTGPMNIPGQVAGASTAANQFSGLLRGTVGSTGIGGSATGSFANNVAGNAPVVAGGVLGNWNVGNTSYKAAGIFAGSGTPH